MKALTIKQPWAELIMLGLKPYEFRGWRAPKTIIGDRIVIHAARFPISLKDSKDLLERLESDDEQIRNSTMLRDHAKAADVLRRVMDYDGTVLLGHALGVARLGEPVPNAEIAAEFGLEHVNDSDRLEHSAWAWPLTEVQRFEKPVLIPGKQGFWNWKTY